MTEQPGGAAALSGAAEALLWNLYQRACGARRPDAVLADPKAVELVGYRTFGPPAASNPIEHRAICPALQRIGRRAV